MEEKIWPRGGFLVKFDAEEVVSRFTFDNIQTLF